MAETRNVYADRPGVAPALVENDTRIIRKIPVCFLDEPLNPMRHDMDDDKLQDLMNDIRQHGLLQNLCVVPILDGVRRGYEGILSHVLDAHEAAGGRYRVAAGHRRLLACRAINLDKVPCMVFCDLGQSEYGIMAIENGSREEPTEYDLAFMYAEWMKEPSMTEAEMMRRSGKKMDFIYGRVELLQGWEFVALALKERKINFAVARALNREGDEGYAKMFLNMAVDQGATGRLVTAWVQEHQAHIAMTPQGGPPPNVGAPVTVAAPEPVECLLCGDRQSYMLRTVLLCANDVEHVKRIRARVDSEAAAAAENGANKT